MTTFTLPESIPPRADGQDEIIAVLVLRRQDPPNPDGSASADLPSPFSDENRRLVAGLVSAVEASVFDPALSYVTNVSSIDVDASAAVSVAELAAIFAPAPDPEPPTEG